MHATALASSRPRKRRNSLFSLERKRSLQQMMMTRVTWVSRRAGPAVCKDRQAAGRRPRQNTPLGQQKCSGQMINWHVNRKIDAVLNYVSSLVIHTYRSGPPVYILPSRRSSCLGHASYCCSSSNTRPACRRAGLAHSLAANLAR